MAESALKARLTKRLVDMATADGDTELRIWDASVRGLLLRVWPSGRKTYALKARVGKQQKWITIGEHGVPWTPESARDRALQLLTAITRGEDPTQVMVFAAPPAR